MVNMLNQNKRENFRRRHLTRERGERNSQGDRECAAGLGSNQFRGKQAGERFRKNYPKKRTNWMMPSGV